MKSFSTPIRFMLISSFFMSFGYFAHPYQANSFNYPITKFLASLTIDNDRLC